MKPIYNLLLMAMSILLCFMFLSCESEDDTSNRFVVVSSGSSCDGYYIVDGDDPVSFSVNKTTAGSTYYYSLSQSLDSPTSLTVHVNAFGEDVTNIVIYIYEDDELKEQETFTSTQITTTSLDASGNYIYNYSYLITGDIDYSFGTEADTDDED